MSSYSFVWALLSELMGSRMLKSTGLCFPVYLSATCVIKSTLRSSLSYRAVSQVSLSLSYSLTKEDFYEWSEALVRSPLVIHSTHPVSFNLIRPTLCFSS